MASKSKATTNVWTCADEQNVAGLRKSMLLVPSAAAVAAWSYRGGNRRGVVFDKDKQCYSMSDGPDACPATILHIAAVYGSLEVAMIALAYGARVDQVLGKGLNGSTLTATALTIARQNSEAGLVPEEFVNLLEMGLQRGNDRRERLLEEEAFQRTLLETRHNKRMTLFEQYLQQGMIELVVEVRGLLMEIAPERTKDPSSPSPTGDHAADEHAEDATPSSPTVPSQADATCLSHRQVHSMLMRRCASRAEVQGAVDRLVGQSTSISFVLQHDEADMIDRPSGRCSPVESLSPTLDSPERQSRHGTATSGTVVELNSKNVQFLLCRGPRATCIARPLLRVVAEAVQTPADPKKAHKANASSNAQLDVSAILDEVRLQSRSRQSNRSQSRLGGRCEASSSSGTQTPLEMLRKAVEQHEQSVIAMNRTGSKASNASRTIAPEDEDALVDRLYSNDVKQICSRREERVQYIAEGAARLGHQKKNTTLTPELEESVARLCYEGVSHKAEKVAQLEEALMATVPKPKECTLAAEDAEIVRERLTNPDHKEEVRASLREKYHNDIKRYKKLSKSREAAVVANVYTTAIEKKQASLAKMEEEYGDFRLKKKPSRQISRDEERAMGDRLCKKA